jgi:hypothetical protein
MENRIEMFITLLGYEVPGATLDSIDEIYSRVKYERVGATRPQEGDDECDCEHDPGEVVLNAFVVEDLIDEVSRTYKVDRRALWSDWDSMT